MWQPERVKYLLFFGQGIDGLVPEKCPVSVKRFIGVLSNVKWFV